MSTKSKTRDFSKFSLKNTLIASISFYSLLSVAYSFLMAFPVKNNYGENVFDYYSYSLFGLMFIVLILAILYAVFHKVYFSKHKNKQLSNLSISTLFFTYLNLSIYIGLSIVYWYFKGSMSSDFLIPLDIMNWLMWIPVMLFAVTLSLSITLTVLLAKQSK